MIDQKFELRQSILGLRGAFGAVLEIFIQNNESKHCKIITADTSTSAGLGRFKTKFPELFLECGISEQSAAGVATGISLENIDVFLGSFSPFIIGRCWEQIRLASYMEANLTIFGFGAGLGLSYLGFTHCSLEDCSLVNAIPNTTIFEPSTPSEVYNALKKSSELDGIKYIRLTGDGPINKSLMGGYLQISENARLFINKSNKVMVCSGYLASRLIDKHKKNFDFIVLNQISNLKHDITLKDTLNSYQEVICFHESYENFIYKIVNNLNLKSKVTNISPQKKFCKPGDFKFVSEELNFNLTNF